MLVNFFRGNSMTGKQKIKRFIALCVIANVVLFLLINVLFGDKIIPIISAIAAILALILLLHYVRGETP